MRLNPYAYFLLLLLVLPGLNTFAQQDTLYLRNGEKLIGELKEISQGEVTFYSINMYEVTIKEYKIRTMYTTLRMLRIETTDHERLFGKFLPCTDTTGAVYLVDGDKRRKLMLNHISLAMSFKTGLRQKLEGKLAGGMSFSRSADVGLINLHASIKYTNVKFASELTVGTLSAIDTNGFTRDQEKVQLAAYYLPLKTNWLAAGYLTYQRNLELLLLRRLQGVLGVGNKFITSQHFNALAVTGISAAHEKSITGQSSANTLVELPVMLKLDFFNFGEANVRIGLANAVYKGLSQPDRFRYDGNLNIEWEFLENLAITTNIYTNYDSKPLSALTSKTDYGIIMGLSYSL